MVQKKYDLLIAVLVFVVQLPMLAFITIQNEYAMFGAEYGDIAASVVEGQGYANAIIPNSDLATAWMLPGVVGLLTLVFLLFGVKTTAAAYALMVLTYAFIATAAYLILRVSGTVDSSRTRYLVVPVFLAYVFLHKSLILYCFSDIAVNILLTASLLALLVKFWADASRRSRAYLVVPAFVLPLCNPALSLAFGCIITLKLLLTVYAYWRAPEQLGARPLAFIGGFCRLERRLIGQYLSAIVVFAAAVALWGGYNYSRMGKFVASKSNLWHELYLANYHDADGIPTSGTFNSNHLGADPSYKALYLKVGEIKAMEFFKDKFLAFLREHPEAYAERVKNRVVWALVWNANKEDYDNRTSTLPLGTEELQKLKAAKLIMASAKEISGGRWTPSVAMDEQLFVAKIKALRLKNEQELIGDWQQSRAYWIAWRNKPVTVIQTLFDSLIPLLCFAFGLLIRSIRNNKAFIIVLLMYLVYLLPYMLVSHYLRYHLPLIPLQVIVLCSAFSYAIAKLPKRTKAKVIA